MGRRGLITLDGRLVSIMGFEVSGGLIRNIYVWLDPDLLAGAKINP